ncbi:RNA exonuclease 4 [Dissostichus eleginoides]|uniref:RNA exonuclease 4 n=1 Tax=Dissostichus eleginoides TaxID=100907 RepID=A0AAD9BDX9_DISEL|nr:RNA exonuclease 4 [Dissostichus eleginoides]
MSAVKEKTKDSSVKKGPATTENKYTVKKKRKQWMKEKFKTIKPQPQKQEKAKVQQVAPPKDGLQFSANWKALQEMLKASQPEKKQPVTPKPPNGALLKKETKEKTTKNISKNNPGQKDTGKKEKQKAVVVAPKDSKVNSKGPAVSEVKQSAAPKRKKDSGKINSEQPAKKKKMEKMVEETNLQNLQNPDDIEATVGAEAADIMRKKQGIHKSNDTESSLVKEKAFEGLTRAVAIDCEMVGVGPDGEDSILARASLVNQFGKCIYDKYVKPTEKVTDYRTAFSGIRPEDIIDGEDLQTVQREVAEILQGRIVVGHAIHNDLKILLLDHPKKKIRDTQKEILNVKVQQGEHSSVQDAQATMRLYTLEKKKWEADIKASHNNKDSDKKRVRKPKSSKNKNMNKNLVGF